MIDQNLVSQINKALAKEPKVILAYVLGSSVSGTVRADSDFDLAVLVEDKNKITEDHIYKLISNISFPKDLDLSVVDKSSSPLFLYQIISTGICVYIRSDEVKISYEAYILRNYYDNAHIRNIYDSCLKDKFSYASK